VPRKFSFISCSNLQDQGEGGFKDCVLNASLP
jgi:hypothetical protein